MSRALIVSAGTRANEYLTKHLTDLGFHRLVIVPSAAEARRRMTDSDFALIAVNAPLPDEFGHEFCIDAVESTDAGVILLVKAAEAEQIESRVSEQGVFVLSKPFSISFFGQVVHMASAGNARLQRLRQENNRLHEKITQIRLVSRAKLALITEKGMSEADAHRYIEKAAMNSRKDRKEIAQEILDSFDTLGV